VVATRGLRLATLPVLEELWTSRRADLREGKPVATKGSLLVPILHGPKLKALLCLENVQRYDSEDLAGGLVVLTKAVVARSGDDHHSPAPMSAPVGLESYLGTATVDQLERKHLMVALEHNEWNIARVARVLGVTRRTIYLRVRRLGIERKHVSKA